MDQGEFVETLYVKYPKQSKYSWMNGRFGNETSMFTTCDPALHRLRRAPLNPMYVLKLVDYGSKERRSFLPLGFQGVQ